MCDQLSPQSLFTSPPLLAHHRSASFPNTSLSLPQFTTISHQTISSFWSQHAVGLHQQRHNAMGGLSAVKLPNHHHHHHLDF